jgi:hypothetical protein
VFRAFARHQVDFPVYIFVAVLRLAFECKVIFNRVARQWL